MHAPSKIILHYPQPPPPPESARVPAEMYIKVKIMKPKYWTRTQFISHFQTFLFQHKCKIYFRTSVLHVLFEMFEVNWNTHTQTTLKKITDLRFSFFSENEAKYLNFALKVFEDNCMIFILRSLLWAKARQ